MSPRSARTLPAVLVFLLLAGPAVGLGAAGVPDAGPIGPSGPASTAVSTLSAGETSGAITSHNGTDRPEQVMHITLDADGDARWRVSVYLPLHDDTDAFEDLADRFERGETDVLTVDPFEEAAARAGAESGRAMGIPDDSVTRSHRIENDTGVLVLSFTWTGFAERDGDRLAVGDAFNTSAGTWLPSLNERQTLLIAPPEEYGVRSSPPVAVEDGVARWEGPVEFSGREPWIVYAGTAGTETSPPTTPETPGTVTTPVTTTVPPGDDAGSLSPGSLLFVVVVGGLVLVGAYALSRGSGGLPGPVTGSGGASSGSDAADTDGTDGGGPDGADGPNPTAAAADPDAESEPGPEPGSESEDDEVDVALLSDEERVERLLERNGGRMKQASIVTETGWSNAKVSQLLSSMAEEGRVDKLRIGRENLISFPDEDVTDSGSGDHGADDADSDGAGSGSG